MQNFRRAVRRTPRSLLVVAVSLSTMVAGGSLFSAASAQSEPAATTSTPPSAEPAATAPPVTAAPIAPTEPPSIVAPDPTPVPSAPPTKVPKRPKTGRSGAGVLVNPSARGATSIEVDIGRQALYLRKAGVVSRTLSISSGSNRHYCIKGSCGNAHTPRGRFRIYNRVGGWRTSHLGRLYNPLYFTGGFAIHGGNLPGHPASHGCIRISFAAARWLPGSVPNGTPVWVHD